MDFTVIGNIFILSFMLTWWFPIVTALVIGGGVFIFHIIKINKLHHVKEDLQRQVAERSELLLYSTEREQKAREESAKAIKAKSLLLAKVSHEIRTPLNGMLGMSALLTETRLTEEQQEYCATIRDSGEGLIQTINDILLNDILEFSKAEGGMELEQKDFDITNSVEEVLDIFSSKASQNGLELIYEVDQNVPPQIIGDSLRLRQILMNLVENAIEFTSHGEIFIKVRFIKNETNSILLEFEVLDSGKGIGKEKLKVLNADLEPTNTTTGTPSSLGVGLIICKKLAELMGGYCSFHF